MKNTGTLKLTTPGDRDVVMTRVFDAPRRLVWEAMTTPELLKRWFLGPPGWTLSVCEIDLRVGGGYRYVWRGADGSEMGMGGEYREIVPPERIVATEAFDQAWYPGNNALVTYALTEDCGTTTLTLTVRYESREARNAVLKSPMEQGVTATYDRLAEMLAADAAANSTVDASLARHGALSYLEIPAIDSRQSAEFYQKVVGWNPSFDDPRHVKFSDPAGQLIGKWVTGRTISREPGLLAYVYVNDVKAAVEQAVATGGAVVKALYPEGTLLVAVVRDPAGNVIGLWQDGGR